MRRGSWAAAVPVAVVAAAGLAWLLAGAGTLVADEPATGTGGRKVALVWKWRKGEVVRYRNTTNQTLDQTVMGTAMQVKQKQVQVTKQEVTDVAADGTATVVCTFEAIKIDVENPLQGGGISYDSTNPEDAARAKDPQLAPVAGLVGETFTFKVDSRGKVSEVKGFDKILDKMLESYPEAQREVARSMLGKSLGDESMRSQLEAAYHALPDGEVEVGASWKQDSSVTIPMAGTIVSHNTYTLQGFEAVGGKDCARIGTEGALEQTAKAEPDPSNPFASLMEIAFKSGKIAGDIFFDPEGGRAIRQTSHQVMEMQTTVKKAGGGGAGGGGPAQMSMDQKLEQTTELELLAPDAKPF